MGAMQTMETSGVAPAQRTVAAAVVVALVGSATILGAYYFQFVVGLAPCPLCLDQRIAYYVAIPLAVLLTLAAARMPRRLVALGLAVIALIMLFNAGLALYHAGIEWKWWPGPRECSGPIDDLTTGGDLLSQLSSISLVRCDEAAWRFLGLSLAGYDVLISLALSAVAIWGAATGFSRRPDAMIPGRHIRAPRLMGMVDREVVDEMRAAGLMGPIAPGAARFQRIGLIAGTAGSNLAVMQRLDVGAQTQRIHEHARVARHKDR